MTDEHEYHQSKIVRLNTDTNTNKDKPKPTTVAEIVSLLNKKEDEHGEEN
jgi:hypothetical protein